MTTPAQPTEAQQPAAAPAPQPQQPQDLSLTNAGKTVLVFGADGKVTMGDGVTPSDAATKLLSALRVAYADPDARAVATDARATLGAFGKDLGTVAGMVDAARQTTVLAAYATFGALALNTALVAVALVKVWRVRGTQLEIAARVGQPK